jgi:cyclophilin family peptidyl-prolyl cis-trans isomerase
MPTEKRQRQKEGRVARQAALQAHRRRAARRRQVITGVAILAIVFIIVALLQRGDDGGENVTAGSTTTALAPDSPTAAPAPPGKVGTAACPPADGSAPRTITFDGAPQTCIDVAKTYTAAVDTDVGTFTVALDAKKAFNTVNNFVFLARYHFYDGVKFHRVIPGFVVQGGDAAKGDGTGDAGYKFADELPASVDEYKAGSLAMANSGPDTNGSQFFVVVSDEGGKQLQNPSYSLFGQVTSGLDVVQKIEADGSPEGQPKALHQITKVTITEA